MRHLVAFFAILMGSVQVAWAGAWPITPGEAQVIVKYEDQFAQQLVLAQDQVLEVQKTEDTRLSLFAEAGFTPTISLQFQGGLARGSDATGDHDGFAPTSIGVRMLMASSRHFVLSTYVGATLPGIQLSNRFDPSLGDGNVELRALAGWSGHMLGKESFAELAVARLVEFGDRDQTRVDFTFGRAISRRWQALLQVYAGRTDGGRPLGSRWMKLDQTLVYRLGRWSVQSGWRQTLWGQNIPMAQGPVIAIWRKF